MNLIIGCGYLGMRAARLWLADEVPVAAVTRSSTRAVEFREAGLMPIEADILMPSRLSKLAELVGPNDTILYAVGFDRSSSHSMRDVYVRGLANVLDALPMQIGKLIYISSTGVYGQNDGSTVDENSPAEPTREGGRACLEAEKILMAHSLGKRAIILRLAGIYGPDRVPFKKDLLDQKVQEPGANLDGYLNLIHVDDAARIVLLTEKIAEAPQTYLVADGNPVPRGEYYQEISRLWKGKKSVNETASQYGDASTSRQRSGSDKRINNTKLVTHLSPEFLYPDYCSGLAAIKAVMKAQ